MYLYDARVKSLKPRCACTGVVLWLNDPPNMSIKVERQLHDMRMLDRIVGVRSTEQFVWHLLTLTSLYFGILKEFSMTDTEYYDLIRPYDDAMKLLLTRLEILNHNIYKASAENPIHTMQYRIKSKQSIEEKLIRKGEEPTLENAKDLLQDIAGIRIVCYFVGDIKNLIDMLKKQSDLIFIRERDYITNPKPNGYRSHHIILGVNVFCLDASEYYPVEIQLRTISMDFWAAMEHRISYKKEYDNREQRVAELLSYADTLVDMEKEFEKYNENATLS